MWGCGVVNARTCGYMHVGGGTILHKYNANSTSTLSCSSGSGRKTEIKHPWAELRMMSFYRLTPKQKADNEDADTLH